MSSSQQPLIPPSKPSSPPPAYSEFAEPISPPPGSTHQPYGPTPAPLLQRQTHVLPYYDPRSDHSLVEAVSRARWRFVGAVAWAVVIMALAGMAMGLEARYHVIIGP
ncbi:unnamed protein product [Somion occarium]|uniref:Uncharacterized protein n=1 Tax=Somion occarium TaxID=3059160 RepID=A0ABP1D048_9APHY